MGVHWNLNCIIIIMRECMENKQNNMFEILFFEKILSCFIEFKFQHTTKKQVESSFIVNFFKKWNLEHFCLLPLHSLIEFKFQWSPYRVWVACGTTLYKNDFVKETCPCDSFQAQSTLKM